MSGDEGAPRGARLARVPLWALAMVAVAVGGVLGLGAAALLAGGDDDAPSVGLDGATTTPADAQAERAEAFLAAWERYRRATFVAEMRFERLLPDGQRLTTERTVVQDPPRRLIRQGATVSLSDADGSLLCEPIGDETVCTQAEGVDYEASIADDLEGWRRAITGDFPDYVVDEPEPGCFELRLVSGDVAPPYGERTRVCFDETTGAVRSRQVARTTGTDTEVATRISPTVTDHDWALGG